VHMCRAPNDGSTMKKKKYVNNNRSVNVQQIEISRYSVTGPNHAVHFLLQIIPYTPTGTIYNALGYKDMYSYMCGWPIRIYIIL